MDNQTILKAGDSFWVVGPGYQIEWDEPVSGKNSGFVTNFLGIDQEQSPPYSGVFAQGKTSSGADFVKRFNQVVKVTDTDGNEIGPFSSFEQAKAFQSGEPEDDLVTLPVTDDEETKRDPFVNVPPRQEETAPVKESLIDFANSLKERANSNNDFDIEVEMQQDDRFIDDAIDAQMNHILPRVREMINPRLMYDEEGLGVFSDGGYHNIIGGRIDSLYIQLEAKMRDEKPNERAVRSIMNDLIACLIAYNTIRHSVLKRKGGS